MTPFATRSPGARSCTACSKAKRKCDKRSPECRRCKIKKQSCIYPPAKATCFVRLQTPVESPQREFESQIPAGPPLNLSVVPELQWDGPYDDDLDLSTFLLPIEVDMQLSNLTAEPIASGHCGAWFLSPETWEVDHTRFPVPGNFEITDLKDLHRIIQDWLKTWVTTGSNVFIHCKLYRDKFPSVVQAAYTTLSAYTNRIPENTDMILRIVNEQAKELVATIKSAPQYSLDIFEHLANVHALFVYQVIGLLDGDITSRHLAEERSPFFIQFLTQMLENASTNLASSLIFDQTIPSKSLWRTWVISESVRRTWLVGMGFNAAYDGLRQGWTPCGGDIPFTSREGLWTAPSADMWADICAVKDVNFIRRFHVAWGADVGEMDVFGKTMLKITYGKEWI